MNVLAICHAAIRAKLLRNICRIIIEVTGYVLLLSVDGRLAAGIYLLLNGFAMRQKESAAASNTSSS